MPELPEVETIKRGLQKKVKGLSVKDVRVKDGRVIRQNSEAVFIKGVKGQKIANVHRYGKAIVFFLEPSRKKLVVQLMMTGQLIYAKERSDIKETKIIFVLSNGGYLHYNDQRLFGRLQLVSDLKEIKYFRILGVEPLGGSFKASWLKEKIKHRQVPVKSLLMNHTVVAGIGNIYASEILFAAGIRPRRRAASLKEKEVAKLRASTVRVLKKAVACRGTSMRDYCDSDGKKGEFRKYLKVYSREGDDCFSCGSQVKKVVISGRSSFYCPACQH
ncbi:MAG: bifunctional DNA-formamidopyrimidine glycosylase/DNA-(apurinic or apyrimidinic site) lyase [Candidatus Omnitrophica bacterium]|nr:bifunctional DNA-formamidopyrimidine glycosylase/DNA-(apurinic or apyrimidinic site) lyase [Candidatus Omnitrophota bacterium]